MVDFNYRAKPSSYYPDVDERGYVKGNIIISGESYYICNYERSDDKVASFIEVESETIQKSLAMNDSEGREIFEGDVLMKTSGDSKDVFKIKYETESAAYILVCLNDETKNTNFIETKFTELRIVGERFITDVLSEKE